MYNVPRQIFQQYLKSNKFAVLTYDQKIESGKEQETSSINIDSTPGMWFWIHQIWTEGFCL
jgi:hypothetical protein